MGQQIEVVRETRLDNVMMFDTDRSITGQDGVSFGSLSDAEANDTFPGQLAARILEGVVKSDHVFIASNQVVVRRSGGWDDASVADARRIISDFFLYYR